MTITDKKASWAYWFAFCCIAVAAASCEWFGKEAEAFFLLAVACVLLLVKAVKGN